MEHAAGRASAPCKCALRRSSTRGVAACAPLGVRGYLGHRRQRQQRRLWGWPLRRRPHGRCFRRLHVAWSRPRNAQAPRGAALRRRCAERGARGCRTRRTGCLNAVSMLSQLRLIVVSLLRLAAPSGRRPRARVARALCAAMSAEGWLPRDKQEDGGLFASLESLLSQGSDWECEWREPNAHNDTGASVRDGGAAGDAPRVPRVRARGASPSLANVLALTSARRTPPKHARAPLGHLHAARRPYGARCSTQRRSVGRAVPACARCALRARGHAHARDWAAARA